MLKEKWAVDNIHQLLDNNWQEHSLEPNWFRVIAALRGWHPIEIGQTMTVGVNGEEYEITRKQNRF